MILDRLFRKLQPKGEDMPAVPLPFKRDEKPAPFPAHVTPAVTLPNGFAGLSDDGRNFAENFVDKVLASHYGMATRVAAVPVIGTRAIHMSKIEAQELDMRRDKAGRRWRLGNGLPGGADVESM